MFGKDTRTDIIVLLVIAAVAGPLLALKLPVVLAFLSTLVMIALIGYIANMCLVAMPANLVLGLLAIAAFGSVARLSVAVIFAPAALVSVQGLLMILVAGLWSHFALKMAAQVGSWKNSASIGGRR